MNYMDSYFVEAKKEYGIDEDYLEDKTGKITSLEDMFRSVHPSCKAKNFKEFLKHE